MMLQYTDQIGREIQLSATPQRIVSLVPSMTELLFDLGLGDRIVGTTHFCAHPEEAGTKAKIGGTKNVKSDRLRALQPDFIVAAKEENERDQIEALAIDFPVFVSDIANLQDAYDAILKIGMITSCKSKSQALVGTIKQRFSQLPKPQQLRRALYFIWRKPYMVAGNDTFITQMMAAAGFENMVDTPRYPELDAAAIQSLDPEYILLSSEPFPFKEKHITEMHTIAPHAQISIVDGEMFSWYGSRLLHAPAYFKQLLL